MNTKIGELLIALKDQVNKGITVLATLDVSSEAYAITLNNILQSSQVAADIERSISDTPAPKAEDTEVEEKIEEVIENASN